MKNEKLYTLLLILLFLWIYLWMVLFSFMMKFSKNFFSIFYLIVVHFLIILLSWAFLATCLTDPGKPPIFWGFYIDEPQNRRKRYCLTCHVFKPERCHHCSTCNRCVLAMDHHCPWFACCIGYYNRRFFIQTLTYALLTFLFMLTFNSRSVYYFIVSLKNVDQWSDFETNVADLLHLFTFVLASFFILIVARFYRYHLKLLRANNTTIEQLDAKRKEAPIDSQYDLGMRRNIISVMGVSYLGWFLPLSNLPMPSDGVVWMTRESECFAQGKTVQVPMLG